MTVKEFKDEMFKFLVFVMEMAEVEIIGLVDNDLLKGIIGRYMSELIDKEHLNFADTDKGFGFSIEDPIRTRSIPQNRLYLQRLHKAKGNIIATHRLGSCRSSNSSHIIDKYLIYCVSPKGKVMFKVIYIDPYCDEISDKFPEGF